LPACKQAAAAAAAAAAVEKADSCYLPASSISLPWTIERLQAQRSTVFSGSRAVSIIASSSTSSWNRRERIVIGTPSV